MKLVNIIHESQSYASKHLCLWCEERIPFAIESCGEQLRILGRMRHPEELFQRHCAKNKDAKLYMNCVNQRQSLDGI